MQRTMLHSKIHRATVTQADLHYVGSCTIDADLMDAADLLEGQQIDIVDINNGSRLTTYAITGERGSGVISISGAAAHLVHPGDLVIIIAYAVMEDAEARTPTPAVFVDDDNRMLTGGMTSRRSESGPEEPARAGAPRSRGQGRAVLLTVDVGNTHIRLRRLPQAGVARPRGACGPRPAGNLNSWP